MKSKIGIVLSGGYANGAYEYGVLKYIENNKDNFDIEYIVATSIGALNAAAFVSGNLDLAGQYWKSLDFTGFKSFYREIIKEKYYKTVILDILDTNTILQSTTDLYITVTSFPGLELKYFKLNDKNDKYIKNILKAAISVPKIMEEVTIKGKKYIDGGIRDNIPIGLLKSIKTNTPVYIVHFDPVSVKTRIRDKAIKNKIREIQFVNENNKHLSGTFDFSKENIAKLSKQGYHDASIIFNEHKNIVTNKEKQFQLKYLRNIFFILGRVNSAMKKFKNKFC